MRKAVLLQNVARPPDAFVGNPDRLVVTTGKIGGLQKIVERLPVEATPAGTGDLVVMVPLEALQIKEREGQFDEWMMACSRKIAFICVQMNMKILSLAVRQGERGI